jgi:hypothetical protein
MAAQLQPQSRTWSSIEAVTNLVVGYFVSLIVQVVTFQLYSIRLDFTEQVEISVIFTIVSFVRSYALRRLFNGIHRLQAGE